MALHEAVTDLHAALQILSRGREISRLKRTRRTHADITARAMELGLFVREIGRQIGVDVFTSETASEVFPWEPAPNN